MSITSNFLAASVINVAKSQIGTTDGGNNTVKYNDWLGNGRNAWCQVFIDWCFDLAFGSSGANTLLCGLSKSTSTIAVKDAFGRAGRLVNSPKAGDIWWRERSNGGHTGLIYKTLSNESSVIIYTIEGNTSNPNGSGLGGDGVYVKSHIINTSSMIDENGNQCWFGRPAYDGQGDLSSVAYGGGVSSIHDNDYGAAIGGNGRGDRGLYSLDGSKTLTFTRKTYTANFEDVTTEVTQDIIKTADINDLGNGGYTNLLSYPSLIEVPFVQLKVGNYTFGKYTKESNGSAEKVDFPNYIKSMSITKINGLLNQYTILLQYLISTGDDPNLLDRIFSSVGFGKVYLTYGDYNSPTFIYKEEEAILTKVTSLVNFSNSSIDYTINCTSTALLLASNVFDFEKRTDKPSNVIFRMLEDSTYGLTEVFTGMSNITLVKNLNLICTDDQEVEIDAKPSTDPITYLQYLVTCMSASTNGKENVLKDSTYRMTIHDDNFGDLNLNGSYFKITKISSSAKALATQGVYEVDVGYPNDNQVMSFSVNTDNSWQLLYEYSDSISTPTYTYDIDNKGNLVSTYSPSYATSSATNKMTETLKTWWTNMTLFPISAQLVLKGLVRPTILMTYIRVNALFYGLRHDTSGLYIITGQKDDISDQGYRTTLSLTRVAGDSDYIEKVTTQVTSKVLTGYDVSEEEVSIQTVDFNSALLKIANGLHTQGLVSVAGKLTYTDGSTLHVYSDGTTFTDYVADGTIYTGDDIGYTIWKYLRNNGCTEAGAAGILGNLYAESDGLEPKRVLYSFKDKADISRRLRWGAVGINFSTYNTIDETMTAGVDSGKIPLDMFKEKFFGYGLCLWTYPGRKVGLYNKSKSLGVSIGTLDVQLPYLLEELKSSYPAVWNVVSSTTDVNQACDIFLEKFESPADIEATRPSRRSNANSYYQKYAMANRTTTGRY